MIAAYVEGVPLNATRVYERVTALRSGPAAALIPDETTAEGRQLVRWLTQVVVTEQVLCNEATRRGLSGSDEPWPLGPTSRVQLGSTLAAALAGNALATAAAQAVTADTSTSAPPAQVRREQVLRWVTSSGPRARDNRARPWIVDVSSVPDQFARTIAAGVVGATVSWRGRQYQLGDWLLPLPSGSNTDSAVRAARNVGLLRWVDERIAETVTLAPGFEHPGDFRQPDHTHHH